MVRVASGRRLFALFIGIGLFITVVVVALLAYPNFTLFWNQDALPVETQILYYSAVVLVGMLIGYGIQWKVPFKNKMAKEFISEGNLHLKATREAPTALDVIDPAHRYGKRQRSRRGA